MTNHQTTRIFAVTGAKGTGKSTILTLVQSKVVASDEREAFRLVDSPGRAAHDAQLPLGERGSDATHLYFADRHLQALVDASPGVVLLDRCFVDHLAYVRLLTSDRTLLSLMERIMSLVAARYTAIFLCTLHDGLPEPHAQTESREFRVRVEREIRDILISHGMHIIALPPNLDDALDLVWRTMTRES